MMSNTVDEHVRDKSTEDCIRGGTQQGGIPDGTQFAAEAEPKDMVEEASLESFPASDAPSWTPMTSLGPPSVAPAI